MAPIAAFVPGQVQMACWQIALRDGRRKATSGGPRDRARHLAYQRAYEAARRTYGVRVAFGDVARYTDRRKADRVRRGISALRALGCLPGLIVADRLAAGVSVATIHAGCETCAHPALSCAVGF